MCLKSQGGDFPNKHRVPLLKYNSIAKNWLSCLQSCQVLSGVISQCVAQIGCGWTWGWDKALSMHWDWNADPIQPKLGTQNRRKNQETWEHAAREGPVGMLIWSDNPPDDGQELAEDQESRNKAWCVYGVTNECYMAFRPHLFLPCFGDYLILMLIIDLKKRFWAYSISYYLCINKV